LLLTPRMGQTGRRAAWMRSAGTLGVAVLCLPACAATPSPKAQAAPAPALHAEPAAPAAGSSPVIPNAEIEKLLAERLGADQDHYGIVAGVVDAEGRRLVSAGRRTHGDAQALDGSTLFEIGSITKVFTSLLLADAVVNQRVSLDDPVAKYLPPTVRMPERGSRPITLLDLATHSSGLPRLPNNLDPRDDNNPYADYGIEQLYAFLSTVELTRDPGAQYEYSNLGAGLLGHALARESNGDYASLVRARITAPLGMSSTAIALSPELQARLVPGHDEELAVTSNWDLPTLAGAGALRSSADDMLTFLAAAIGLEETPLAPAFALSTRSQRPTETPDTTIALGWHITKSHGKDIVWHNGGTGGYRSFIGFDPKARAGVVVLTNRSTRGGPDDIGRHLLDPKSPLKAQTTAPSLPDAAAGHAQVDIDPRLLDRYVGHYQLAPSAMFTVTRRGDALFAQLSGQPTFRIFPESDTKFFYKVVDAQLTFEPDGDGPAGAVVLHQGGRDQRAPRLPKSPVQRAKIRLAPAVFDRYAGRYELTPQAILTVLRQNERFFVHLTGQRPFEVFAASERDFFLEAVDAQLSFELDANGKAVAVTLHQNGADRRARRLE
jgi:serine-type D-Ala-D-Ala carboxypeptidase/endopeptidase